jgi:hypothetical protein
MKKKVFNGGVEKHVKSISVFFPRNNEATKGFADVSLWKAL